MGSLECLMVTNHGKSYFTNNYLLSYKKLLKSIAFEVSVTENSYEIKYFMPRKTDPCIAPRVTWVREQGLFKA